jgi:hypothetical protein
MPNILDPSLAVTNLPAPGRCKTARPPFRAVNPPDVIESGANLALGGGSPLPDRTQPIGNMADRRENVMEFTSTGMALAS